MTKQAPITKNKAWHFRQDDRIASGLDRLIILFEFDLLEEHLTFVHKHFKVSQEKYKKIVEEAVATEHDLVNPSPYTEHLAERYSMLVEDLPRLQWYAQFLVVYSTFENALNELCRIVERKSESNLSFKDFTGQGIVRASLYLKKLFDVKQPFQSPQWHDAMLFGDIRNAIAHRNGRIDADARSQKTLAFRIRRLNGVKLKKLFKKQKDADIHLSPEFLKEAIRTLRKILTEVADYKINGEM